MGAVGACHDKAPKLLSCYAGGFTADNPFPSRYSPVPASPKAVAVLGMQSPLRPASPAASGFAVMGGQTLGGANC